MKKVLSLLAVCLIDIHILTASSILITDLRCESLTDPLGIDNTLPHFSWKIQSTNPVQPQYYEIQVASDSIRLIQSTPDLWNSGKTRRPASVMVPYEGKELRPRMLCYWRVRIWDEKGEASDWSPIGRFAVGILENDKLQGAYIGLAPGHGDVRAPLLRKTFTIDLLATTFLHVSSLGYHEAYINGIKADSRVLAPVTSQLDKRSLIVTYDITPYLQQGENEIVLWLGQGWYKRTTFGTDYDGPLVKAEMDILQNGNWQQILTTDTLWSGRENGYSDTDTWQALRFGGERIDGRLLPGDLSADGLNKLEWFPVTAIPVSNHRETPQMCEPDKIQEVLPPPTRIFRSLVRTPGWWILEK